MHVEAARRAMIGDIEQRTDTIRHEDLQIPRTGRKNGVCWTIFASASAAPGSVVLAARLGIPESLRVQGVCMCSSRYWRSPAGTHCTRLQCPDRVGYFSPSQNTIRKTSRGARLGSLRHQDRQPRDDGPIEIVVLWGRTDPKRMRTAPHQANSFRDRPGCVILSPVGA